MSLTIINAKRDAISLGIDVLDAEVLLAKILSKNRTYLYTWPDKILTEEQWSHFQDCVSRRLSGEPIAYILGQREFWSLPILTRPSTLIPRPDTEVLVEAVLNTFPNEALNCIDLGTGTGAIALALKSERSRWKVQGIDRMQDAVDLATENAQKLQLDVQFSLGNWLANIEGESHNVIVSNPPYIDEEDTHLNEGDVRFEPRSALVASDQGLSDIKQISAQALKCLAQHGCLFLEHGWKQAEDVREILASNGYSRVETIKDYGGNERVTFGFKPE